MPKVPRSDISWGQGAEETGKPGQQERALTVQPLGNTKTTGALRVTGVLLPTQTDPKCYEGDAEKDQWPCGEEQRSSRQDFCQVACGVRERGVNSSTQRCGVSIWGSRAHGAGMECFILQATITRSDLLG